MVHAFVGHLAIVTLIIVSFPNHCFENAMNGLHLRVYSVAELTQIAAIQKCILVVKLVFRTNLGSQNEAYSSRYHFKMCVLFRGCKDLMRFFTLL